MKTRNAVILAVALIASTSRGLAQQSASFRLNEHVFNAGGRPTDGTTAGSASHRISIDAIGDGVFPAALTGASHQVAGGFVSAYPPPGEVNGLRFSNAQTLFWNPEPSVGAYHLYRGALTSLSGLAYGACQASSIAGPTTNDASPVPPGTGFFYLVTARNMIWEEGVKGRSSAGALRANDAPCP